MRESNINREVCDYGEPEPECEHGSAKVMYGYVVCMMTLDPTTHVLIPDIAGLGLRQRKKKGE